MGGTSAHRKTHTITHSPVHAHAHIRGARALLTRDGDDSKERGAGACVGLEDSHRHGMLFQEGDDPVFDALRELHLPVPCYRWSQMIRDRRGENLDGVTARLFSTSPNVATQKILMCACPSWSVQCGQTQFLSRKKNFSGFLFSELPGDPPAVHVSFPWSWGGVPPMVSHVHALFKRKGEFERSTQ